MGGRVAPVSLALKAEGISEVKAALRGVKASFVEMERDSLAATRAASKERIALLKSESKEKIALLKQESAARREVLASERSFKRTLSRSDGDSALGAAGKALMKGEGFDGMLKAAGVAGIAVATFASAINFASASLKQFASFLVNDVIRPGLELETRSQQVANNSGGALTAADVQAKSRAIGLRNNINPMSVIEATGRFQDLTGEPALGFDIMSTVAAISKGRGYDMKSLAELGAAGYRPGMKAGDLSQLLLTLTGQGEKGSIPIGELARLGGRLTAPAEKLGGDWFTKVTTANALLQTAKRTGFGTVDSAAEGLERFTQDAFLKGKSLSPKSFATVNGVDSLIDPVKYLGDIFRRTRGAPMALHGMGFSEPSQKFIGAYQGVFSEGYANAKASGKDETAARDAGARAVEQFVNTMKTTTSTLEAEEQRRSSVTHTAGEELLGAFEFIKAKLFNDVGGDVDHFVSEFTKHTGDFANAASMVAKFIIALGEAVITMVNGVSRLKSLFAEDGDVVRVAMDRGDKTELPGAPRDLSGDEIPGFWRKGDGGNYEYVKGAGPADESAGHWGRVGKLGQLVFMPGADERAKADAGALASFVTTGEPLMSEAVPASMMPEEGEASDAAQEAADAHQQLAADAADASEAVCRLTTCVQDLTSALGALPRNDSFMRR